MLIVNNLSVSISSRKLINNLKFDCPMGSLLAVIGSNGAGKSTLIDAISQHNPDYEGEIRWDEKNMKDFTVKQLAKTRAILTQKINMTQSYNVEEVVMMGRYPYFGSIPEKEDWQVIKEKMYDTNALILEGRKYYSLSGGEAQRVHLARVLSQLQGNRKLLMLDEPLNNLDIKHQLDILQLCKAFAQAGNSVIIVLHDINLAASFADRILLLHRGQQLGFGSPENVLKEDLLLQCYGCPVHIAKHPFRNSLNIIFDINNNISTSNHHIIH